ncbi:hypothetical protein [Paenibacillus sp. DMB5]|uniref:hypothetical protein n=1 Tax=Paenibacillus sp. DMB5 TaxID=1780103 RepID=UPI00076C8FFA|nr:hypothetical protein [Paenibacillus sp. DMB5]KUP22420.1 hypothetical protein AWJ19_27785 [Paenibacillus sp. DMB5]
MNNLPSHSNESSVDKVKSYTGMIPDHRLPIVMATNENEATQLLIQQLRELFRTASDEEIADKFGLIIWSE